MFDNLRVKVLGGLGSVGLVAGASLPVLAADPTPIEVSSVFSGVYSTASGALTTVLPYCAAILGAIIAIKLGVRLFRSMAK